MKIIRKLVTSIFVILTLFATMFSCTFLPPKEKEFSDSGMTITLTDSFFTKDIVGYTAYYQSTDAIVIVLKEERAGFPPEYQNCSLNEYAELVCQANGMPDRKITAHSNYSVFDYNKTVNGDDYYYYACCYKTEDAYWLIQFACFEKDKQEIAPNFDKWAGSVRFNG